MTPQQLGALHRAAFVQDRPWSAAEFHDLLVSPHVTLITDPHGFALCRTVAGEAELLTLAVDPAHQRQGIARRLCATWLDGLIGKADTAFLEVAADNHPALKLYNALGFCETGRRVAYYLRRNAQPVDAIVMRHDLTHGKPADKGAVRPESG